MGAYQKGGEKSIQFFQTVSTARQMVRSEVSMITRICCTSFSKSPRLRTPSSFRVFHLWHGPARDFDAKPRLFEWASYSCNVTPSPLYPYRPYASTALISRCVDRSVVSPSLPQPMSPCFPQRGRRTGAGAAFQPLAISPY